jgi:hypothetical protein
MKFRFGRCLKIGGIKLPFIIFLFFNCLVSWKIELEVASFIADLSRLQKPALGLFYEGRG